LTRRHSTIRTLGLGCGIISPIIWLVLLAAAGALRPDFSHATNYISELGERGSATEALVRYGAFGFTGFLYLCFAGALAATFPNDRLRGAAALLIALDGVGRIGAGAFPCDPGCVQLSAGPDLHKLFATLGFGSGILAAFLWGFILRGMPRFRHLATFSVVSGAVALISLLLMTRATDPAQLAGLFEHTATAALSIWLLVFAGHLLQVEHGRADLAGDLRSAV
jgi:hypothetical membrane protein